MPGKSNLAVVIGLEIHSKLISRNKLFSRKIHTKLKFDLIVASASASDYLPNFNVAALDVALPGSLPRLNLECVQAAVKAALALNAEVQPIMRFDRKHYSYHDIAAGYQLTQKHLPVARGGHIQLFREWDGDTLRDCTVRLEQLQLEQDTAKSLQHSDGSTLIDFNRSGMPLLEIVTYPDMQSPDEAVCVAKKIADSLKTVGASNANFDDGSIRVDVNVSLHSPCDGPASKLLGGRRLGPGVRTEIKNIHSFKFIHQALIYEIDRHRRCIESPAINDEDPETTLKPATRGFDASSGQTYHLRWKDSTAEYRIFPDPELPIVNLSERYVKSVRQNLPELPDVKRSRIHDRYTGLSKTSTTQLIERGVDKYFEQVIAAPTHPQYHSVSRNSQDVANWILNTLAGEMDGQETSTKAPQIVTAEQLASVIDATAVGAIQRHQGKAQLKEWIAQHKTTPSKTPETSPSSLPASVLAQIKPFDVDELKKFTEEILDTDAKAQKAIKEVITHGQKKSKVLTFITGAVMRKIKGRANPHELRDVVADCARNRGVSEGAIRSWQKDSAVTRSNE